MESKPKTSSNWSEVRTFTITETYPVITSPVGITYNPSVTIEWDTIGASSYKVWINGYETETVSGDTYGTTLSTKSGFILCNSNAGRNRYGKRERIVFI